MTDTNSNSKILMTESTKKVLEDELDDEIEALSDEELLKIVQESKTVAATQDAEGQIQVRQVLNG
ncbi:MAG: hypothetical protein IKO49_02090 [Bacilli bacterium]|nr:hypothetical protein [Clostridia bacterium]MBR4618071.1 hypothetical protein [Bacilli bacterium]